MQFADTATWFMFRANSVLKDQNSSRSQDQPEARPCHRRTVSGRPRTCHGRRDVGSERGVRAPVTLGLQV